MKKFEVWRNESGKNQLLDWYNRFQKKISFPVESKTVKTRFGESHVLIAGPEDAPPVVAFHAMRTGASFMLNEMGDFPKNFRVYAPDLPGQSVKGPQVQLSLKNDEHSEWATDVMDQLQVESAGIFGVSWGGVVARDLATRAPKRVEKLGLLVPAGIVNGSHLTGLAKMAWPMIRYKMRKTNENLKKLLAPLLTTPDPDWEGFIGCSIDHMKMDMRIPPLASDQDLSEINVPLLVLAGDQDISFPGDKLKDRLSVLCQGADIEVLKDCKHCTPSTPEFRRWLADRLDKFFSC